VKIVRVAHAGSAILGSLALIAGVMPAYAQQSADAVEPAQDASANQDRAAAPCMVRSLANGASVQVRVSSGEITEYAGLGYRESACAVSDPGIVAVELSYVCRFANLVTEDAAPFFVDEYGASPQRLCQSARRAASELGLTLDESDLRPGWARTQDEQTRERQQATVAAEAASGAAPQADEQQQPVQQGNAQ